MQIQENLFLMSQLSLKAQQLVQLPILRENTLSKQISGLLK